MIEQVVNKRNLMRACRHVVQNKGSAGVDGMTVDELTDHLSLNRETIIQQVSEGCYKAQPINGVELSAANHEHL